MIALSFLLFGNLYGFSESLGIDVLKKSDLSFNVPMAMTLGEVRNFAKADYGYEIKLATELVDLSKKGYTGGLCSTFFYDDYTFMREEIQEFHMRGFTEGVWVEYALPLEFFLRTEVCGGLCVTKVKAEGIYENRIENNYNSFVLGINGTLTRRIYDFGPVALFWNGGVTIRFFGEEDTTNADFGVTGGIKVKAGKKWR